MARKNYTIDEVLEALKLKNDVKIVGKTIFILKPTSVKIEGGKLVKNLNHLRKDDLGNKSWGKIDFLSKYCGYNKQYIQDFDKINEMFKTFKIK